MAISATLPKYPRQELNLQIIRFERSAYAVRLRGRKLRGQDSNLDIVWLTASCRANLATSESPWVELNHLLPLYQRGTLDR